MRAGREGIILREPLQSRAAKSWANWSGLSYMGARFFDDEQKFYIDRQRYVPLLAFAYWLRHADLLAQLTGHLPAMADDLRAQELTYHKQRSAVKRRTWWVIGISLLVMAGTVVCAVWARHQPAAQQAMIAHGEHILDRWLARIFAVCLAAYGLFNFYASFGFLRRKHFGYAVFWFLFGVMQILLAVALFAG